jgi:phosphatidylglycerol---prolipoprotein diacylglyceryl transferase
MDNMHPILFKIGNVTLYTHGVLAVLGILVGSYILYRLAVKSRLDTSFLFDNIVYSVLIGIIGARLTYFLLYPDQFRNLSEIFYLWQGGMVSYGGFIPGFIAFVLLLKYQKQTIMPWLNLSAIAFSAGLIFGRIGNIFAGEYSGVNTLSKYNLGGKVPVTLYEAVLLLFILAILVGLRYIKNSSIMNYSFYLFISLYTLGRFVIDFWRDESKMFLHISIGQITSLSILLITLLLLITTILRGRNSDEIDTTVS